MNGETYGPVSTGPTSIRDGALSAEALKSKYDLADMSGNRALAKVVAELEASR